jgi:predicted nucleic acid-binding protein
LSVAKIVVNTDVVLDHLHGKRSPSVLREAMGMFFCYTTVFNAIELFSMARSEAELGAVEGAMAAMKVLGLNARSAKRYGALLVDVRNADRWNALIAGLCLESRLPLLTDRKKEFAAFRGLVIVPTRLIKSGTPAQEILSRVSGRNLKT